MIKRIIFDLDDTLIIWKDEYTKRLFNELDKYKLDVDYSALYKILDTQELRHNILSREAILDDIYKELNLKLDMDILNDILNVQKSFASINEELIDTLKYLSKKYELVVLTNWFSDVQIERLKNALIYDYFNEIYCGDKYPVKPIKEAFLIACGNNKPSECVMVGDNIKIDIEGAKEAGLNVIQVDLCNKYKDSKYSMIRSIDKLKEML